MASKPRTTLPISMPTIDADLRGELIAASRKIEQYERLKQRLIREHGWQFRFFSQIAFRGPNECWEWQGSRQHISGHGVFQSAPVKTTKAHRVAYMVFKGDVPNDLLVCHSCDNPPCCNPNHLWLGTLKDNAQDSWRKGRAFIPTCPKAMKARGEKQGLSKLTDQDVREIRLSKDTVTELALKYGCNRQNIQHIRNRNTWRHL